MPLEITRKMARIKVLVVLGAIGFCQMASAGSIANVTITNMYMGNPYGGLVFIAVTGTKTGNPSCSYDTTWSFVLKLTNALQNQMYAALLAARAAGTPVNFVGTGLCDTYPGVETLDTMTY